MKMSEFKFMVGCMMLALAIGISVAIEKFLFGMPHDVATILLNMLPRTLVIAMGLNVTLGKFLCKRWAGLNPVR